MLTGSEIERPEDKALTFQKESPALSAQSAKRGTPFDFLSLRRIAGVVSGKMLRI